MRFKIAPIAILLCVVEAASADDGESLNGRWSAGVMQSAWSLVSWGDECGPSPVGGSEAGGIVTITQSGHELNIVGLGRNFSTNACWDQQPGISAVTHTSGARRWSTTCRSAAGDPRRVAVSTSISLNGTALDLEESGRYDVAIAGRQCSASVRRTRRFVLIQREGDTSAPTTTVATAEKPFAPPTCTQAGPVARIEASPTYKLLRPGEHFSFKARLLDEKGCPLAQKVVWRLAKPYEGVQLDSNGKFDVASSAPEGEVQLSVQYGEHAVQLFVYIVSAQRYQELLASPSFNPAGESEVGSVKAFVPTVLGARGAAVESSARRRRVVFVWAVAGLALLLGAAAVVVARRRRHWVPSGLPKERPEAGPTYSETKPAPEPVRLICPVCGTQYDAESQFCGKDGASLVPLN